MKKRSLEELNVLDDFLFQEMVTRGEEGENFCRILLSTILGKNIRNVKVIPQKNIRGINPDRHGIKIDAYIEVGADMEENGAGVADAEILPDIYNIEPNKYRTNSEAKRTRYYHSLIDTKILRSGVNYEKLKNVVIIMILPYDPFGKDRMIYTFASMCEEDHTIEYDDGMKTIYLYTKGKKGSPSTELRNMLKYIENSTKENADNENLRQIHRLVDEIRHDKEVDISYMKSWEWEAMFREEGLQEGMEKGIVQGETIKLISIVRKKAKKGMASEEIAEFLEEKIETVAQIQKLLSEHIEWTDEQVYEEYAKINQRNEEALTC